MKFDPWCDSILGDWTLDDKECRKKAHKGKLVYKRSAEVKLHKDHALERLDPDSMKKQKVHGTVVIIETKIVDRGNSAESRFRGLELTPDSVLVDVIV
jgi:hypothetical protein